MSKKKSINKMSVLRPDNYIRQKSRNLPVNECLINSDWKKSQLCELIISRKHVTGALTVCFYLVDLLCLGVKDTFFKFNISPEELKNLLERRSGKYQLINISYELAHNIIYAGVEYAEEYGFKPHKDFSSTTIYFLEEDNDAVPLIKVKCGGLDGKPCYTNTGFDSPERERAILVQLEQTAGKYNYDYILPASSDMYFADDDN